MMSSASESALKAIPEGATEIDLKDAGIDVAELERVCGALKKNMTVQRLDLSNNMKLDARAGVALRSLLQVNASIEEVELSGCKWIGSEGIKQLCKALQLNLCLKSLGLRSTGVGPEAAKELSFSLKKNRSLEQLVLRDNSLGIEGAQHLASAIEVNDCLTQLDISDCEIGDEGAVRLSESLRMNKSIEKLDMWRNKIGERGIAHLRLAVAENSTISSLNAENVIHRATPLKRKKKGESSIPEDPFQKRLLQLQQCLFGCGVEFTEEAFRLASEETDLFAWDLSIIVDDLHQAEEPSGLLEALFSKKLWLQCQDHSPMAHVFLKNRESQEGVEAICTRFLNKMSLEDGRALFRAKDRDGRTFRSLASGHANPRVVAWAKSYGTYLGCYEIVEGPPVHESRTCAVHFATDITNEQEVALKIMKDEVQYKNEIKSRGLSVISDQDVCEWSNDNSELKYVVPVIRAHVKDQCIVMPRATRSLFESINTEQFVARQLGKIRSIARSLAIALQELKENNRIHADVKPRNFVRVSKSESSTFCAENGKLEQNPAWRACRQIDQEESDVEKWKLIDLDASVKLGEQAGEKYSSGYCPPELARSLFAPEGRGSVEAKTSFDVWSFGAILFQMLSGTKLFMVDETDDNLITFEDKAELCNWIVIDKDRLNRIHNSEWPRWEEEFAKDLVRGCLMGDPEERFSFEAVLAHPFFQTGRAATPSRNETKEGGISFQVHVGDERKNSLPQMLKAKKELRILHPQRFHFFLSHMQKEAAGIVKDLYLNLNHARCSAWIDMHAEQLTAESMRQGVENSSFYVLVLTKNVLFRPFCMMELYWAIKHHSSKHRNPCNGRLLFVVEDDPRFSPWNEEVDVPWLEGEGLSESYLETVRMLKDGLSSLLDHEKDPGLTADTILELAKKCIANGVRIPYRRRSYEEEAMIERILSASLFHSPLSLRKTAAMKKLESGESTASSLGQIPDDQKFQKRDLFILHHESGHENAKRICDAVRADPYVEVHGFHVRLEPQLIARAMVQKIERKMKPESLLLIMLKENLFKGNQVLQAILRNWICKDGRPCVVLQENWQFGGEEQESIESLLRSTLFEMTEIMPFRHNVHEFEAMIREAERRLMMGAAKFQSSRITGKSVK